MKGLKIICMCCNMRMSEGSLSIVTDLQGKNFNAVAYRCNQCKHTIVVRKDQE